MDASRPTIFRISDRPSAEVERARPCLSRSRQLPHRVRVVHECAQNLRRVPSAVGFDYAVRVRALKGLRVAPPALRTAGGPDLAIREPECAIIDGLTGASSRGPRTTCLTI